MNDGETNFGMSFSDDLSDEWMDDDLVSAVWGMNHSYGNQTSDIASVLFSGSSSSSFGHQESPNPNNASGTRTATASAENENKKEKKKGKERVAFRTRSEVEVLEDGFKWRKYGKKMVKNSPYHRNYFKCSVNGCVVKKRVERDRDDPSFVITTYEGCHNHHSSMN